MVLSIDNIPVPEFINAEELNNNKNITRYRKFENSNIVNPKDTSISIFGGNGFISSRFCEIYNNKIIKISRGNYHPQSKNVLYFFSTNNHCNLFVTPQMDIDTSLKKLINVLDKCKDNNIVFNFISSSLVYGECQKPAKENSFCHPKEFYGIAKKCAEELLISYCIKFNIPYRILRLGTVYGKSQIKAFNTINALNFIIDRLRKNKLVRLYFYGNFIRDYIHIDDVVRGIDFAIENTPINSKINIGSGISYKFNDLIREAKKIIGSRSKIELCSATEFYKIDRVKDICLDVNKLNSFGFQPNMCIKEGILELCS